MNEQFASDLLKIGTKIAGLDRVVPGPAAPTPVKKFHDQPVIPGLILHNYTDRKPDDEGKYVIVTTHTERVELIIQEPTELEKKEKREADQFRLLVVCGTAVCITGAYLTFKYLEKRRHA